MAARWARQSTLSGGESLSIANGWKLKNHGCQAHALKGFNPALLVVMRREGEQRGVCSADQVQEQSVVVFAWNKNRKGLLRLVQLKCVDVGEMRVLTNNSGAKIEEFGKF